MTYRVTWYCDMDGDPCDEWLAIELSPGVLAITVSRLWTPSLLRADPHDRCDRWLGELYHNDWKSVLD